MSDELTNEINEAYEHAKKTGKVTVSPFKKIPKPNLNLRNSKTRPGATYDTFKYYIGNKNSRDEKLTAQMLRTWAKDPNRRLECIYDGETWPANYWYCPRCKEYKGLQPFIRGWSDWQ